MLNTSEKITALAIFATSNPDFLKAITEMSETVRGMESRLVKMTAVNICRSFENVIQRHPLEANLFLDYRFTHEHSSTKQLLPADVTINLARLFLSMGYIGGEIVCTVRYNAGRKRYVYTFYFD